MPELAVTSEDLDHLCKLVEMTDGGPSWHQMMDKSLPNMSYQAWRREPEVMNMIHRLFFEFRVL